MNDLSQGILAASQSSARFRYAAALPQRYGKSTIGALALPLWCLAYGHARHIVLLCASRAAAAERMRQVQRELESNELLLRDFPHLRRLDWRGGSGISRPCDLVVSGALRLVGMYRHSPVAALSHRGKPPDLIITDDLDGQSSLERDHLWATWRWWDEMVEPRVGESASIIMLGTPKHLIDLLLHRVVCGSDDGWLTRRYRAILKYPTDLRPLCTFERIHCERMAYQGATGPVAARAWLCAGVPTVLNGGEVAWPAKESLLELVLLKARVGWVRFDAAKQCRPARLPRWIPLVIPVDGDFPNTTMPCQWVDDAGMLRVGRREEMPQHARLVTDEEAAQERRRSEGRRRDWNEPLRTDREFYEVIKKELTRGD